MQITLDNKIRILTKYLSKEELKNLKEEFRHHNPDFHKKNAMGFSTWNTPRFINTFEFKNNGSEINFLKGSLPRILNILENRKIKYIDNRYIGKHIEYSFDPSFEFRPYQLEAIESAIKSECGMIRGAAGSGKTEISLGIIKELGVKTAILIHDSNLMDQWKERISKRLGIPVKEIGQYGGGKKKIGKQITVMMYQTVKNHLPKLANRFGCIIADEIHHTPANTFLKVAKCFTAKYIFGFSATIERQDLKHIVSYDLFGNIVYDVGRKYLVELGYLTDIEMNVVETDYYYDYCNVDYFTRLQEQGVVKYDSMKVDTQRKFLKEQDLKYKDYSKYLDNITRSSNRNSQILYHVLKELKQGKSCILFTMRREFCRLWKRNLDNLGFPCVILWGTKPTKSDKKETKESLKKLRSGEVKVAVGTVLNEAIDLPRVDVGFITYRNVTHAGQQEQQAGRLARLFEGKDKGKLYYFWDKRITKFENDLDIIKKRFDKVVIHGTKKSKDGNY